MGLDLAELPSYLMEDNLSLKEKEEKMAQIREDYLNRLSNLQEYDQREDLLAEMNN